MSEIVKTRRYNSADEFLMDISYKGEMYEILRNGFIFRGHQSGAYKLIPSVLRLPRQLKDVENGKTEGGREIPFNIDESEFVQMMGEFMELRNFFNICDKNSLRLPPVERFRKAPYSFYDILSFLFEKKDWLPEDLQELAALAQHYGMKTRLLDWTTSIETAIYFAVYDEPELNQVEGVKDDSDCVAIWALNPMITFGINTPLRIIRPPYYGNPNLAAQNGLFTFWNVSGLQFAFNGGSDKDMQEVFKRLTNRKPLDELIVEEFKKLEVKKQIPDIVMMWKLLVPRRDRIILYKYIINHNVNAASLFPGYEGIVRCMRENKSFGL